MPADDERTPPRRERMMQIIDHMLDPGEIREELELAGIDVTAPVWSPRFAIVGGDRYEPHTARGYLLVNGEPHYSAAWL